MLLFPRPEGCCLAVRKPRRVLISTVTPAEFGAKLPFNTLPANMRVPETCGWF